MAFYDYLSFSKIIDLKSRDKTNALTEMTRHMCRTLRIKKHKPLIEQVLSSEKSASSFIGQGIAIPKAETELIKDDFAIAIGRAKQGIEYDAARNAKAHLIILVFTKNAESDKYMSLTSEISAFFKVKENRERFINEEKSAEIVDLILTFGENEGQTSAPSKKKSRRSIKRSGSPVIDAAVNLVKATDASSMLVFADNINDKNIIGKININKKKLVVVTENSSQFAFNNITDFVRVPAFSTSKRGQIKVGILLALSKKVISKQDTVVCLSGNADIGELDTVSVVNVSMEYHFFYSASGNILPPNVKPEVLERVLGLASEIAAEGREGKPTGTIFVVGDSTRVTAHSRQLIINPFRGCTEAERNILDPGLEETIKEFCNIDGAFIITGDGGVLTAGSFLRPDFDNPVSDLQSGLGTRHVAAIGITACTNAISVVVSESTGRVSVFKSGKLVLTLSKPVKDLIDVAPKR